MEKEFNFITFLNIAKENFQIILFDKSNLKSIYENELIFKNNHNKIDFELLSKFLDGNIYKVEKLLGNFIKDVVLIIDSDFNYYTNFCIKKFFNDNLINKKNLKNVLIDAKDLFNESYQKQNIIHMIIKDYYGNGLDNSSFEVERQSDYLSLEINFISLPQDFILKFGKILKKYEIKTSRILCRHYLESFLDKNTPTLPNIACKIIEGENKNEILLVPKSDKNTGIFEKFFQIFS